jgi:hypothetical protein
MELPVACTLTDAELRERRRTILDSVRRDTVSMPVSGDREGFNALAEPFATRHDHLAEVLQSLLWTKWPISARHPIRGSPFTEPWPQAE